jgi:hypothetical protein
MVNEDLVIENGHKLIIQATGGGTNVQLSTITIVDPLLQIDRGIKALKDLNIYGFVGMSTDPNKVTGGGALMMGHGFTSSTDPPQIRLTDSGLINSISYSENFLESIWTGYDGFKTNVTNSELCPDGTFTTAYKFDQCGQSGRCRGCWQSASTPLQQNQKYTASIWLKGTYDNQPIIIGLNDTYNTTVYLTQTWKRYFYSVTIPSGGSTSRGLQFYSAIANDTYYAWGAQLEAGPEWDFPDVYRSYVKTENGPNLKFDTFYLYGADGITPANLDLGTLFLHGNIFNDLNKVIRFSGSTDFSPGTNMGIIQFEDTYFGTGHHKILDFKGWYNSERVYEWNWVYSADDGSTWDLNAALDQNGLFKLPAQGSSGGLQIGWDANLYRSAVNTLKTDGNLIVHGNLTVDGSFQWNGGVVTGDIAIGKTDPSFGLYTSGTLKGAFGHVTSSGVTTLMSTNGAALSVGSADGVIHLLNNVLMNSTRTINFANENGQKITLCTNTGLGIADGAVVQFFKNSAYAGAFKWSLYNGSTATDVMTLSEIGVLTITGSTSAVGFNDRTQNYNWYIYAVDNKTRIWNGSGDVLRIDNNGNLEVLSVGLYNGSTLLASFGHTGVGGVATLSSNSGDLRLGAQSQHVRLGNGTGYFEPYSSNTAMLGEYTNMWTYVWASYLKYDISCDPFDNVDDLALAKSYTIKKELNKVTGIERDVIDKESIKFLTDDYGFFEVNKVHGFLLGCSKASALKLDEQEAKIADLLKRIEDLESAQ